MLVSSNKMREVSIQAVQHGVNDCVTVFLVHKYFYVVMHSRRAFNYYGNLPTTEPCLDWILKCDVASPNFVRWITFIT